MSGRDRSPRRTSREFDESRWSRGNEVSSRDGRSRAELGSASRDRKWRDDGDKSDGLDRESRHRHGEEDRYRGERRGRTRSRSRSPRYKCDKERVSHEVERYGRYRDEDGNRGRVRGTSRDREKHRDRERVKERNRDRETGVDRREREVDRLDRGGRRRRSPSEEDSESDSSSDNSDEERRRRQRKERRREEKEERRRRKERKREEKKKKKDKSTAAVTMQWGKYGIISETDITKKDSEFRAWLVEERKLNPETISKDRTKKEFATFVEDFNTATLPSKKYYDMGKYEFKMNLIRSGQTLPLDVGTYDPLADMKAHTSKIKSQTEKKQSKLSKTELEELRRVEAERIEISKRRQLGLDVPRGMGIRTENVMVEVTSSFDQ